MPRFTPEITACMSCYNDPRIPLYRTRWQSKPQITLACSHTLEEEAAHIVQNQPAAVGVTACSNCGRIINVIDVRDYRNDPLVWNDARHVQRIFRYRAKHLIPRVTCSKECHKAYYAEQARQRRGPRPETRCGRCDVRFKARKGTLYCSTACRVAAHRAMIKYNS